MITSMRLSSRPAPSVSTPTPRPPRRTFAPRAGANGSAGANGAPAPAGSVVPVAYTVRVRAPPEPSDLEAAVAAAFSQQAPAGSTAAAAAPQPAASSATGPSPSPVDPEAVVAAKVALLERVAGLNRGALASPSDREAVDSLARRLEALGGRGGPDAVAQQQQQLERLLVGRWELVYSSVEAFRNSPFFGAFSNVVTGITNDGGRAADAIFAFTDSIPGATIGAAYQTIDLAGGSGGRLVSEVDLSVFPGLRGTVVTSSRLGVHPERRPLRLALTVESTRVERSNLSPFLDAVSVPVEQLIERVRGSDASKVDYDVTYLDDKIRVTRCGGQLMVHRKA